MRRRDLIFVGAAAIWPLAARAQQPAVPVVGFMSGRSEEDSARVASAFRQGLADAGFIEGQTVKIEYRWANGDYAGCRRSPPIWSTAKWPSWSASAAMFRLPSQPRQR